MQSAMRAALFEALAQFHIVRFLKYFKDGIEFVPYNPKKHAHSNLLKAWRVHHWRYWNKTNIKNFLPSKKENAQRSVRSNSVCNQPTFAIHCPIPLCRIATLLKC